MVALEPVELVSDLGHHGLDVRVKQGLDLLSEVRMQLLSTRLHTKYQAQSKTKKSYFENKILPASMPAPA